VNATVHCTELLREYAATGAESAFTELVRCQVDLVYSAALRRCGGDAALAAEVSQTVFTELARRARSPRRTEAETVLTAVSLGGWLYHHTTFVAATAARGESRRRHREETAMQLQAQTDSTDWSRVAPILEDAMAELSDRDRDALVQRFFEKDTFAQVGARLDSSGDAARVRVNRALDRLREQLARRGVTSTAAALTSSLSAFGVAPAPAGLAATISTIAIAPPVAGAGATIGAASWFMLMRSKLALGVLGGALLATVLVRHQRTVNQLTADNAALRQQITGLNTAALSIAEEPEELERRRQLQAELLQLRGEVSRLRRDLAETTARLASAATATATNAPSVQVNIEGHFFEVPDAMFQAMGLSVNQNGVSILDRPEAQHLFLQHLKQLEGVESLGTQKVITLGGQQAQISVVSGDPDNSSGQTTAGPAGVTLDVIPTTSPDSQQLELAVNVGYLNRRESQEPGTRPPDTSFNPRDDGPFGPMQSGNFKLRDGQMVALRQPARRRAESTNTPDGPRSLLVLVTPTLMDPTGQRLFPDEETRPATVPESAAP
jgi:RNA polymerase sigma factor (sigma-70 family)